MIVVGAILGWLTSIILQIEAPRGILLNMVAGVAGAFVMGLFIAPLFGGASLLAGQYGVGSLLLSLLGSMALIAALNVLYRQQLH